MNKLFIRLFVAFVAFSFGLILTNLIRPRYTYQQTFPYESVLVFEYSETGDDAQIRKIYREYGPAQTRHDREFFERIETEDFTLTVGDRKMSREEDIQSMESAPTDKTYISRVDHVRVFDRLAVAHGYLEAHDGNGVVRLWPFVDVWVKTGGAWRIQSTISQ
jgi:hypothetical protein